MVQPEELSYRWVVPQGEQALTFYANVFQAKEICRELLPDGRVIAAELMVGAYRLFIREVPDGELSEDMTAEHQPGGATAALRRFLELTLDCEDPMELAMGAIVAGGQAEVTFSLTSDILRLVIVDPAGHRWAVRRPAPAATLPRQATKALVRPGPSETRA